VCGAPRGRISGVSKSAVAPPRGCQFSCQFSQAKAGQNWLEVRTGSINRACSKSLEMLDLSTVASSLRRRPRRAESVCPCRLARRRARAPGRGGPAARGCGAVSWLAAAPEPAADEFTDLVDRLRSKAVAVHLEALQVLGEPHLKAEDFQ